MDVLQTLEGNVTQWQQAIDERTQRADFLRGEISRLVGESIDLSETKAKQARTKRAEYAAELEQIGAELDELARRHGIAVQAVKEYHLNKAQEASDKASQEATTARLALNAALDERLHFLNHGGRGESDESIKARRDIEVKIATTQAAARIADRNAATAGRVLQALSE